MVKVYVLPADSHGCGHYRLIWPAQIARSLGMDITIMPPKKDSGFKAKVQAMADGSKRLVSLAIPDDADVIVLQRPAHELQPQMIRMLRQHGIAVVVDMDDDMTNIHRSNVAYTTYHPKSNSPYSWKTTLECCDNATLITTSTKKLLGVYARRTPGVAIDNYVPVAAIQSQHVRTGLFGWAGTTQSHPDDLQVLGGSVQRLLDDGLSFKVVGPPSKVKEGMRLREEPDYTGVVGMADWIKTVGQTLDVAMAPLSPSPFNASKSRLKIIEAMAAGIPYVASAREEYRRTTRESGGGLLADTPKEWVTNIKRLMTDESLYADLSEAGRQYIATQTYEEQGYRWAEAWTNAYELERSRSKVCV